MRASKSVLAVNAGVAGLGLPVGTVLGLEVHAVATEPLGHEARGSSGTAAWR